MATGTATRPAVNATASASVPASPVRSSGDIASPRRSALVAEAGAVMWPAPSGGHLGRLLVGVLPRAFRLGTLVRGDQFGVPRNGLQQLGVVAPGDHPAL